MRVCVILNKDGGTLKSLDMEALTTDIEARFVAHGHEVDCRAVAGEDLMQALSDAFDNTEIEAVVAGGGDGTISAAAGLAWKAQKPLGILPAGTMNLYARALGMPLDLDAAVAALAAGTVGASDIATANGRPYLHQFAVGFHRRMIEERNQQPYETRLGKIKASVVAALDTIRRPPSLEVHINIDGVQHRERVSSLSVSNNPYGEGHLPYADAVLSGELGIYYARPATVAANAKMLADITLGTWRNNPDIIEKRGREVVLTFTRRKRVHTVIDGELVDIKDPVTLRIHPGELPVILPGEAHL
ncbi:diacylglycerol/lipid kinase family protein [Pseudohoeflea coraliihabitans]|uniref:Diacylglycerol kinase family lipid kinase n=1 Tax=Pseudohoeflea coraliihabitans TaxID=2860393 RepID=A0ABS6WMW5_9HYPH|nr:diacylglycerol kinase family protein [Pseudohoeflea sp. DP4N28-3]MBW3097288.1 diacylglycerol kinase family lipid kinase [Pseudohoeflea sp. DP4N28-3]